MLLDLLLDYLIYSKVAGSYTQKYVYMTDIHMNHFY